MSYLILIVVLVILAGAVLRGYHQGFLRTALSMVSLVLTIILVGLIEPHVTGALKEYTPLEDVITKAVYQNMEESIAVGGSQTVTTEEQVQMLEDWSFPQVIQDQIVKNTAQAAETFAQSTSEYVADMALNIIGYLLTFLVVFILIRCLFMAFDIVGHIPVIRGVNKWLGGLLGFFQGMFLVWILCLAVTLILPSDTGVWLMASINSNPLLSFLYNTSLSLGITL